MSSPMNYKGYDGSVKYSAEDRLLYGEILGIRDTITYDGTDVASIETNFKAAVDEYLRFCQETGKEPEKPFPGTFNVRVGSDLHRRASLLGAERGQKLNKVVAEALEEYLKRAS